MHCPKPCEWYPRAEQPEPASALAWQWLRESCRDQAKEWMRARAHALATSLSNL
jgi:hypothetical protein